jgi:predicted transcriptional regulator
MTDRPPGEVCETLSRRADLLEELRDGPAEKRKLVASLSVSRSTVDRATSELAALGLVAEADGRVRTTAAGDAVAALYRDATAAIEELLALGQTLEGLDERFSPPPSFFGSTDVVTTDQGARAPAEHLVDAFLDADRCRLVRGPIRPTFAAPVRERMFAGTLTVDATLCLDAVASMWSYHGTDLERVLDLETVTVREFPESLHSGLYLFETDGERHVSLSIQDERNDHVRALLGTDRHEAVAWAERTLDAVAARATPLERP